MLIRGLGDFDAETLQPFVLRVDIIDPDFNVQARAAGSRLVAGGMDDKVSVAKSETRHILFVGVEFPPQRLAIEFLAARQVRHLREHIKNALDRHDVSYPPQPCLCAFLLLSENAKVGTKLPFATISISRYCDNPCRKYDRTLSWIGRAIPRPA